MKKLAAKKKRTIFFSALCALLIIASIICFTLSGVYSKRLLSQHAADRWAGDGETKFSQISCFMPVGSEISINQVYNFRTAMINALQAASFEVVKDSGLWDDAWSTTGKLEVSSAIGRGEATITAVGGDFFNFHPLTLVSGSYFEDDDLMKDRVLLDRELAWLLFGSSDVQGLEFTMAERTFIVAGVIEREQDAISQKAYSAGMGLYMAYDTYLSINENAGISCYEFIMAEPVGGYARSTAETSFFQQFAEIVDNTHRFEHDTLLSVAFNPFDRVMQNYGVLYPYWENAARYTESICGAFIMWAYILLVIPVLTAVYFIIKYLRRGKHKLDDDIIPNVKENISESIRRTQRKRWEKYHGRH